MRMRRCLVRRREAKRRIWMLPWRGLVRIERHDYDVMIEGKASRAGWATSGAVEVMHRMACVGPFFFIAAFDYT